MTGYPPRTSGDGRAAATQSLDPNEKVHAAIRDMANRPAKPTLISPMLDALVRDDDDIVGLVAYAMHEVNRRDWCRTFERLQGRLPSEAELNGYLVGEQIDRRVESYRRLAEDTVYKTKADQNTFRELVDAASSSPITAIPAVVTPAPLPAALAVEASPDTRPVPPRKKGSMGKLLIYLIMLTLVVAGLGFALKSSLPFFTNLGL